MSILIKGMEMPTACHECRMYQADIYYCSAVERVIDISDSSEGKCQFCPLVPVPPHGRLIDRDELSELLEKYWSEFALNASESKDYNLMYEGFGIRDAKLVADGLPIIISADKEGRE